MNPTARFLFHPSEGSDAITRSPAKQIRGSAHVAEGPGYKINGQHRTHTTTSSVILSLVLLIPNCSVHDVTGQLLRR